MIKLYAFFNYAFKYLNFSRFHYKFIYSMMPSFYYKLFFCMSGASNYFRLLTVALFNYISYLICCLIPIHNWHAKIHEYHAVLRLAIAHLQGIPDQPHCLLSTCRLVNIP